MLRASKVLYDEDLIDMVTALSLQEQQGPVATDSARASNSSSAAFSEMLNCSMMHILMEDPVTLMQNGLTYDRKHLCKWLLMNPTKDPLGKEYDEPLSYGDAVAIRKCLMEKEGDSAYVPFNDAPFKSEYPKVWREQNNQDEEINDGNGVYDVEQDIGLLENGENLNSLHNMGVVYSNQRKYDEALELLKRALKGREASPSLGENHPDTLQTVNDIGVVYSNQRKYDEALKWYERSLRGREASLGKDHPDTLQTVKNMAFVALKLQSNVVRRADE